jgi:hypothetical protein
MEASHKERNTMTQKETLKKIASDYSKNLAAMIGKLQPLEGTAFPMVIDVSTAQEISKISTTNVVYIITSATIPKNIGNLYSVGRKEGLAIAQYNNYRKPGSFLEDRCIYVGSCSKSDISTRLRQHIGLSGSERTSSLHLKCWWKDAKIKIYLFKFEDSINNKETDDLQTIEDTAWDVCRPLFGKKGPRARRFKEEEGT